MWPRAVRLPPAFFLSFLLRLRVTRGEKTDPPGSPHRGPGRPCWGAEKRAGITLARSGRIETGLGAKQSTAVLAYPSTSGSWRDRNKLRFSAECDNCEVDSLLKHWTVPFHIWVELSQAEWEDVAVG
jgi:hypothetical protein